MIAHGAEVCYTYAQGHVSLGMTKVVLTASVKKLVVHVLLPFRGHKGSSNKQRCVFICMCGVEVLGVYLVDAYLACVYLACMYLPCVPLACVSCVWGGKLLPLRCFPSRVKKWWR